ncbi:hypothetical protein B0H14DRAFT_2576193 [Mycena olivaceomarginata]|nr:hypothetical protein B0H14DRAFT_2576193 [Mycena olivaceomarginata]
MHSGQGLSPVLRSTTNKFGMAMELSAGHAKHSGKRQQLQAISTSEPGDLIMYSGQGLSLVFRSTTNEFGMATELLAGHAKQTLTAELGRSTTNEFGLATELTAGHSKCIVTAPAQVVGNSSCRPSAASEPGDPMICSGQGPSLVLRSTTNEFGMATELSAGHGKCIVTAPAQWSGSLPGPQIHHSQIQHGNGTVGRTCQTQCDGPGSGGKRQQLQAISTSEPGDLIMYSGQGLSLVFRSTTNEFGMATELLAGHAKQTLTAELGRGQGPSLVLRSTTNEFGLATELTAGHSKCIVTAPAQVVGNSSCRPSAASEPGDPMIYSGQGPSPVLRSTTHKFSMAMELSAGHAKCSVMGLVQVGPSLVLRSTTNEFGMATELLSSGGKKQQLWAINSAVPGDFMIHSGQGPSLVLRSTTHKFSMATELSTGHAKSTLQAPAQAVRNSSCEPLAASEPGDPMMHSGQGPSPVLRSTTNEFGMATELSAGHAKHTLTFPAQAVRDSSCGPSAASKLGDLMIYSDQGPSLVLRSTTNEFGIATELSTTNEFGMATELSAGQAKCSVMALVQVGPSPVLRSTTNEFGMATELSAGHAKHTLTFPAQAVRDSSCGPSAASKLGDLMIYSGQGPSLVLRSTTNEFGIATKLLAGHGKCTVTAPAQAHGNGTVGRTCQTQCDGPGSGGKRQQLQATSELGDLMMYSGQGLSLVFRFTTNEFSMATELSAGHGKCIVTAPAQVVGNSSCRPSAASEPRDPMIYSGQGPSPVLRSTTHKFSMAMELLAGHAKCSVMARVQVGPSLVFRFTTNEFSMATELSIRHAKRTLQAPAQGLSLVLRSTTIKLGMAMELSVGHAKHTLMAPAQIVRHSSCGPSAASSLGDLTMHSGQGPSLVLSYTSDLMMSSGQGLSLVLRSTTHQFGMATELSAGHGRCIVTAPA